MKPFGLQATRLLCPLDFPVKNTGVGCHFLLPSSVYVHLNSLLILEPDLPIKHYLIFSMITQANLLKCIQVIEA